MAVPNQLSFDAELQTSSGDTIARECDPSTAIIVPPPADVHSEGTPALTEFRQGFMSMHPAAMQLAMAEYKERRKTFRDWLKAQLVEGVHFGFPPGCEPKFSDDGKQPNNKPDGAYVRSGTLWVPKKQWTPKPSFYKAGADFVCDLLWARDEYDADIAAWQQLGSPPGTFVFRCRLYSRKGGDLLGEGRGCRRIASSKMAEQENAAIKMAKKSAKVDAVLNTWGMADVFVQDLEDTIQPPHTNPEADPEAPQTPPRDERVPRAKIEELVKRWKATAGPDAGNAKAWAAFVESATGREFDPSRESNWRFVDAERVDQKLIQERGI